MSIKTITGKAEDNGYRVGIVASKWNSFITDKLLEGALEVLKSKGFQGDQVTVVRCPGAYEIPFTTKALLSKVDGVITVGAVIRGDTPHFDYVCQAVNNGVLKLNLQSKKPVVFGVLTTDNVEQASERSTSESNFGNKGAEAALALVEMLSIRDQIDKL
ncbi:MAG: 6,7-dimethyl-8-ribityllumazine synthase [Balneolaceae bacterium]|nr:6,7-dimethyl-8-ribityllumazine synthase [Balneolaceae bacterium]